MSSKKIEHICLNLQKLYAYTLDPVVELWQISILRRQEAASQSFTTGLTNFIFYVIVSIKQRRAR